MHIEIRPYLPEDDLDVLTDLIHRAYAPHLALGLRYWATHQSSTDTEKRLLSGTGLIMLADGKYSGTATVRPPQPNSPVALYRDPAVRSLSQFCVAPEYKGKGLGARLHQHATEVARLSGASLMALDTALPALALIALYERWGYRVVGRCDWRPDTNYESVVMVKDLIEAGCAA
jgi:GNAT superfamily N-acetyltransferase